jgi:hypothetical protein
LRVPYREATTGRRKKAMIRRDWGRGRPLPCLP